MSDKGILVRDPAGGRSTSYSLIASAADAFDAVGRWAIAHAEKAAFDGAKLPSPEECRARTEQIEAIGRELQELARDNAAALTYGDFESRLQALHKLGFYPEDRLVSAVARATVRL